MKNIFRFSLLAITMLIMTVSTWAQSYEMIDVVGGTIEIGATAEQEADSYPKEHPAHSVQISDFSLGKYEVSQSEWISVMGDNPTLNNVGNEYPIEYIDWMSAIICCNEFTMADGALGAVECVYYKDASFSQPFTKADYSGNGNSQTQAVYMDYSKKGYRLPTEAEWEFAARGGINGNTTKYAGSDDLDLVAAHTDNSDWTTFPKGSLQPNELGFYDMSGNLWEMVADWYGPYTSIPQTDPQGPATGTHRVLRGGAYDYSARMCRVSTRYMFLPDDKDSDIGFRMARNK